jgi:hypothetical protein
MQSVRSSMRPAVRAALGIALCLLLAGVGVGFASDRAAPARAPVAEGGWTLTPAPNAAHSSGTLNVLRSGKALAVGGDTVFVVTAGCELYDPYTHSWKTSSRLLAYCGESAPTAT